MRERAIEGRWNQRKGGITWLLPPNDHAALVGSGLVSFLGRGHRGLAHPCSCYIEAKLNGFYAAYGDVEPAQMPEPADRLTRGPAYEMTSRGRTAVDYSDDWPAFRHDNRRSGAANQQIPAELKSAWQSSLGWHLSTVTIADGKVFVAAIDAHTLHALDRTSGKVVWSFLAGARIDSPSRSTRSRRIGRHGDSFRPTATP